MPDRVAYLNGEYVPEREARISVFDSALMYGDMAFETTRTFNGRLYELRGHLNRLYASLRLLEIDCGLSIDDMERVTRETLERNVPTEDPDVDWQIMHNVSRGPLDLYRSVFPRGGRATISINCWPLITHMGRFAPTYEAGVKLVIPAQQALPAHLIDPKAKTRSRLHYQLAQLQARRMGSGAWPVLLDPDGFLAEGPGCNIFLVRDGELFTPEPRNILLGISRATTIQLAKNLGFRVRECNMGRHEALQADEIFCTATTYCLVHAVTFEGQQVGESEMGPVFHKLTQAWKRHVGVNFVAQARKYASRVEAWEERERRAAEAAPRLRITDQ